MIRVIADTRPYTIDPMNIEFVYKSVLYMIDGLNSEISWSENHPEEQFQPGQEIAIERRKEHIHAMRALALNMYATSLSKTIGKTVEYVQPAYDKI